MKRHYKYYTTDAECGYRDIIIEHCAQCGSCRVKINLNTRPISYNYMCLKLNKIHPEIISLKPDIFDDCPLDIFE